MRNICLLAMLIILLGCKSESNKTEVINQINDELAFEKDSKDFQTNRKKVKLYFWDKEKDTFRLTSYCLGWLCKPDSNEKSSKWDIKWKVFTADKSVRLSELYTTKPYPYFDSNTIEKKIKSENYELHLALIIPSGFGTITSVYHYYIFEYFSGEKQLENWDIRPIADTVPKEVWGNRRNGKIFKAQLIIE